MLSIVINIYPQGKYYNVKDIKAIIISYLPLTVVPAANVPLGSAILTRSHGQIVHSIQTLTRSFLYNNRAFANQHAQFRFTHSRLRRWKTRTSSSLKINLILFKNGIHRKEIQDDLFGEF